jgi:PAS domain S-box-containing protein
LIVTGALGLILVVGGIAGLLGFTAHLRGQLSAAVDEWAEEQRVADRISRAAIRQFLIVFSLREREGRELREDFRAAGDIVYDQLRVYLLRDLTSSQRIQLETIKEQHQQLEVAAARAADLFGRGETPAGEASFDVMSAHAFAMLDALDAFLRMREADLDQLRRAQTGAFRTMYTLGAILGALLLLGAATWGRLMFERVDRPLAELTAAAREMERGDLAVRVPEAHDEEFATVAAGFNTMAASLADALGAARRSEETFRHLFSNNPLPMWVYDLETLQFLEVNAAAVAHYGYPRDEFLSMRLTDIRPPEDLPRFLADVARERAALDESRDWRHRLKDGRIINVDVTSHLLTFGGRRAALLVAQDITRRKQAEDQLRASEERHRGLVDHAMFGIYRSGLEGKFLTVNPALADMLGYESTAALLEVDVEALYVDPAVRHELLRRFRETDRVDDAEVEWKRRDGRPVTVRLRGRSIRDAEGRFQWFEMFAEDVTAQRAVEARLRQSQKMEAIGQLTAGIAHDFNNLLSVIIPYAQFAMDQLPEADPLRDDIREIHDAGRRAADLTRHLLAFGRQQILEPQVISLNDVLDDVENMLRRLLRENIAIDVRRAPELGSVLADPGQVEQVIVNLAVNSRDAMPGGGKLTIETGNVEVDEEYAERHVSVTPGRYVRLSVTDTGSGMSAATRDRIFEPFFTTKEKGKGTGLGLATAFGIVKQSGGNIWVYSEPGAGTTFKIYLPRVDASAAKIRRVPAEAGATGTETVLVAEDEDAVRRAAVRILESAGYRVLVAANGDAAVRLCEQHQDEIRLLLTDVVMPNMSGRELALRVRALIPGLTVLFMSGYADDAIVHHGVLDPGTRFIGKPFSVAELRRKVREVLDET